jgi:hypothetical protein
VHEALKHGVIIGQPTDGLDRIAKMAHRMQERGDAAVVFFGGARDYPASSRKLEREGGEPRGWRSDVFVQFSRICPASVDEGLEFQATDKLRRHQLRR